MQAPKIPDIKIILTSKLKKNRVARLIPEFFQNFYIGIFFFWGGGGGGDAPLPPTRPPSGMVTPINEAKAKNDANANANANSCVCGLHGPCFCVWWARGAKLFFLQTLLPRGKRIIKRVVVICKRLEMSLYRTIGAAQKFERLLFTLDS